MREKYIGQRKDLGQSLDTEEFYRFTMMIQESLLIYHLQVYLYGVFMPMEVSTILTSG